MADSIRALITMTMILVSFQVSAEETKLLPPPRFAPPSQQFDRQLLSGAGKARSCFAVFGGSGGAHPSMDRQDLESGLANWSTHSNYQAASLNRLVNIEISLPSDQVTYLRFQHREQKGVYAFVRMFAGETADGDSVPLVMERKDPSLRLVKGKRNFELGVLTKTEGLGDVTSPLLDEVVQYLSSEVPENPEATILWATARPAQARLYQSFGFQPTSQRTQDGMIVLRASLQELREAKEASGAVTLPLLTAEEFQRIRAESREYSAGVREWYLKFWENEEILATAEDAESLQYKLHATMRWVDPPSNGFFSMGPDHDGYERQQAEARQDRIRGFREVAASLVVEDRRAMGLGASPVLRLIANYLFDYRDEYRFNHRYRIAEGHMLSSMRIGWTRVVRRIPVIQYVYDSFETEMWRDLDRQRMDRAKYDPSFKEPWQRR